MTKTDLAEVLGLISEVFKRVEKMPPTPELSKVTEKLTEAGMWARMECDMSVSPTIGINVRENKFYEADKKTPKARNP